MRHVAQRHFSFAGQVAECRLAHAWARCPALYDRLWTRVAAARQLFLYTDT